MTQLDNFLVRDDTIALIVEQLVLEELFSGPTGCRIWIKAMHKKVFKDSRSSISLSDAQIWSLSSNVRVELSLSSTAEWVLSSRKKNVCEHAKCPSINFIVIV